MKKLVLFSLCTLFVGAAWAQRIEPVKTTESLNYPGIIAGKYTCDGKGRVYVYNDDEKTNELVEIRAFDEDLNIEKNFSLQSTTKFRYTLINRRDTVYAERALGEEEIGELSGRASNINEVTVEDFKYFLRGKSIMPWSSYYIFKELERTSSSVTFELSVDEDSVSKYALNDYTHSVAYAKGVFKCTIEDGFMLFKGTKYSYQYGPTYTGEWKEKKDISGYDYIKDFLYLYDYDVVNGNAENIYVITQNFFNQDDSYEYIQPIKDYYVYDVVEQDRDGDGEIDERYIDYNVGVLGFNIVQDNGTIMASVKFGNGMEMEDKGLYSITFANKKYLMANVKKVEDGSEEYYSIFYTIDPSNPTSLKTVRTEKIGIKATPSIARQSEVVSVDVSQMKNPRQVSVVGVNGQTVMKQNIADGQGNVRIQTTGLPAGMYVVKVTDGKQETNNCKIIIR